MSNMPHARYHNTLNDLMDCFHDMGDNGVPVAGEEGRDAKRLIKLCERIYWNFGDTDSILCVDDRCEDDDEDEDD